MGSSHRQQRHSPGVLHILRFDYLGSCRLCNGTDLVQILLDKGVSIKEKDYLGKTALQYACNEQVADFLNEALDKKIKYRENKDGGGGFVFEINQQDLVR